jgi:hypothetical protein
MSVQSAFALWAKMMHGTNLKTAEIAELGKKNGVKGIGPMNVAKATQCLKGTKPKKRRKKPTKRRAARRPGTLGAVKARRKAVEKELEFLKFVEETPEVLGFLKGL